MSVPIYQCSISKAVDDKNAYDDLLWKMKINWECGHWSTFSCRCEPRCRVPSEEEINDLNQRLEKDIIASCCNSSKSVSETAREGA